MGRNRKRTGSTYSSLTGSTTSSPYRVKRIQEREYREKKENHAPPVVPAPSDTVFIKSPLCMAAFSLLEKLYNAPFEMSLVKGDDLSWGACHLKNSFLDLLACYEIIKIIPVCLLSLIVAFHCDPALLFFL